MLGFAPLAVTSFASLPGTSHTGSIAETATVTDASAATYIFIGLTAESASVTDESSCTFLWILVDTTQSVIWTDISMVPEAVNWTAVNTATTDPNFVWTDINTT